VRKWAAEGATVPAAMFDALLRDAPTLGASDVAPMPAASGAALAAVVAPALQRDPQFPRAPTWGGTPVETGAWPRVRTQPLVAAVAAKCGNSVATRMLARMVELAALVDGGIAGGGSADVPAPVGAWSLAPDEGMAAVQTARGLLIHRARLAGGRVAEYQIVAPTEWNFHPDGAFPRGIVGLAAPDEPTLVRHAHLAVQALDPCIACRIDIGHA
jgi:uptake hydrogenase large subunit